jgi:hypothetical protein
MGDAGSGMPSVREIFGSDESDSEDHESDAEDHESDARRSQSHGMFGSSDRLFVGDLDGDLAILAGGDYHGNFMLAGGDYHGSSVSAAPRRVGTGFETRADDEFSERSAARSEGLLGAAHATSPTTATVPQVRRSAFLPATVQMAPAPCMSACPRQNRQAQKGAADTKTQPANEGRAVEGLEG